MNMLKPQEKIADFYRTHHRMPSYDEVAEFLGYKSKNAAEYVIRKLIETGIITKDKTGRLLPENLESGVRPSEPVKTKFSSVTGEGFLDMIDFNEYLAPNKGSSHILKMKGDSMIDAGIQEGDLVIVERRQTYKPGQIVVASIDDELTIKYLRKQRDLYYLESANAKYKPIYPIGHLVVEAVVIGVVRKYQV